MIRNVLAVTAALVLVPALGACGGSSTAQLRVTATDRNAVRQALAAAPLEGFERICLNVVSVRARIDAEETDGAESEDGWHDLQLAAPEEETSTDAEAPADAGDSASTEDEPEGCPSLDLIELLGGPTELAWGEVPAGTLTELRFVLGADQGYAIRTGSETEIPVFVPSGSQSGLKVKFTDGGVLLTPDEEEEVVLEFDGEASIREHNGGAIRIRPVIRVSGAQVVDEEEAPSDDTNPGDQLQ